MSASPATLMWVRESCAIGLLRSCCDTDDFNAVGPDDHHAANRPAVRPEVAGKCFVHDGDARTVHRIAVIEFAPFGDIAEPVAEVHGLAVHDEQVNLRMRDAECLYEILDRPAAFEGADEGRLPARRRQEVVERAVKAD